MKLFGKNKKQKITKEYLESKYIWSSSAGFVLSKGFLEQENLTEDEKNALKPLFFGILSASKAGRVISITAGMSEEEYLFLKDYYIKNGGDISLFPKFYYQYNDPQF